MIPENEPEKIILMLKKRHVVALRLHNPPFYVGSKRGFAVQKSTKARISHHRSRVRCVQARQRPPACQLYKMIYSTGIIWPH